MDHGDDKSPALSCDFLKNDSRTKNLANTSDRGFSTGNLPDTAIVEFQTLYQRKFGIKLPLTEARKLATSLLDLYQFTTSYD